MIGIIDYGMGNVRSVQKGLEQSGFHAVISRSPKILEEASHLILPGVGAFPECMRNLKQYGLIDFLYKEIEKGKPFLGICLGFQLLFTESEEFGLNPGLDLVEGKVVRFPKKYSEDSKDTNPQDPLKIPHMGWNQISVQKPSPLF